jgi:uncharacterized peroxidase-related enzyme
VSRITPIDPARAEGRPKELLDAVKAKLGVTPNMTKTMAVSPAVLEGYLGLSDSLEHGELGARLGEQIALAVAEANACGYCLSAHTYLGKNVVKLSDEEIARNRRFDSEDPRVEAGLRFAGAVVETRGGVSDGELDDVRRAGYADAEIAELVAHVALNVLTNYLNRVADVEIDFPVVEPEPAAA